MEFFHSLIFHIIQLHACIPLKLGQRSRSFEENVINMKFMSISNDRNVHLFKCFVIYVLDGRFSTEKHSCVILILQFDM